jgi:hypothetical protein
MGVGRCRRTPPRRRRCSEHRPRQEAGRRCAAVDCPRRTRRTARRPHRDRSVKGLAGSQEDPPEAGRGRRGWDPPCGDVPGPRSRRRTGSTSGRSRGSRPPTGDGHARGCRSVDVGPRVSSGARAGPAAVVFSSKPGGAGAPPRSTRWARSDRCSRVVAEHRRVRWAPVSPRAFRRVPVLSGRRRRCRNAT